MFARIVVVNTHIDHLLVGQSERKLITIVGAAFLLYLILS